MRKMRDRDGDLWEEQPDGRFTLTHSTRYPTAVGSTHSLDNIERCHGPLTEAKPEQTPEKLRDADGDIWTRRDDGKYVLTRCPDRSSLGYAAPHSELVEQFGPLTEVTAGGPADFAVFLAELGDLVERWTKRLGE